MTPTLDQVHDHLAAYRFHYTTEYELQEAIELTLEASGWHFRREFYFTKRDRIDFFVGVGKPVNVMGVSIWSGLGIEVKVKGAAAEVQRQLARYAQNSFVLGLLLVTTRARHLPPDELHGKPVRVLNIGGVV